jgi:hypothetical protein
VDVIVVGTGADAVFDGASLPSAMPGAEGPDQLPELTRAWEAIAADGPALVLLPSWGPPRQREAYDALRMLVGPARIVLVETTLPPVGASVLAAALAGAGDRYDDAGLVALLAPALERHVVSLAWTASVAQLEHVEVPLGLHARSYVSRKGFVVQANPVRSVSPVTDHTPPSVALPAEPVALVADQEGSQAWRTSVLEPILAGGQVVAVEPSTASARYWGSKRFIEVAIAPSALQPMISDASGRLPVVACRWCGGTALPDHCPTCRPGRPPAPAAAPAEEDAS